MTKWQPIKTAPNDGTQVLIFSAPGEVELVRLAWWFSAEDADNLGRPADEVGWWSSYLSCGSEKISWEPTHWAVWEGPKT